jgi:hypothetical protein
MVWCTTTTVISCKRNSENCQDLVWCGVSSRSYCGNTFLWGDSSWSIVSQHTRSIHCTQQSLNTLRWKLLQSRWGKPKFPSGCQGLLGCCFQNWWLGLKGSAKSPPPCPPDLTSLALNLWEFPKGWVYSTKTTPPVGHVQPSQHTLVQVCHTVVVACRTILTSVAINLKISDSYPCCTPSASFCWIIWFIFLY